MQKGAVLCLIGRKKRKNAGKTGLLIPMLPAKQTERWGLYEKESTASFELTFQRNRPILLKNRHNFAKRSISMTLKEKMQNGELYDCDFDALDEELRKLSLIHILSRNALRNLNFCVFNIFGTSGYLSKAVKFRFSSSIASFELDAGLKICS